jgi:hypothetical protein
MTCFLSAFTKIGLGIERIVEIAAPLASDSLTARSSPFRDEVCLFKTLKMFLPTNFVSIRPFVLTMGTTAREWNRIFRLSALIIIYYKAERTNVSDLQKIRLWYR